MNDREMAKRRKAVESELKIVKVNVWSWQCVTCKKEIVSLHNDQIINLAAQHLMIHLGEKTVRK